MEKIEGMDYEPLASFLTQNLSSQQLSLKQAITKEDLKQLFQITEWEGEGTD